MIAIKHDEANPDLSINPLTGSPVVRVDIFTGSELGYWITIDNDEIKIANGDYFIKDDDNVPIYYFTSSQYAAGGNALTLVTEAVGQEIIRSIMDALRASSLPATQKAGIVNTINTPMDLITYGGIVEARGLANTTATNANYTAGIKTALLALMDAGIAKL